MTDFTTWAFLVTYAGTLAMVMLITQLAKSFPLLRRIPARFLSYLISLAVMYPAHYFTGNLNRSTAVLILFNAVLVALAANGGYEGLLKMFHRKEEKDTEE